MIDKFIRILAESPKLFNFLRKILENNFKNQKKIIHRFSSGKTGEKILDIGCGTGEFSVFFNPDNYTGVDIEKKYIDYANNNFKGKFLVADASNLPFADKFFGKILISHVLHHLNDEECLLIFKEARRVLKIDGKIIVIDMNAEAGNFLTQLLYKLDRGKFIRTEGEFRKLLTKQFSINSRLTFQDGLYPRLVFILS